MSLKSVAFHPKFFLISCHLYLLLEQKLKIEFEDGLKVERAQLKW